MPVSEVMQVDTSPPPEMVVITKTGCLERNSAPEPDGLSPPLSKDGNQMRLNKETFLRADANW